MAFMAAFLLCGLTVAVQLAAGLHGGARGGDDGVILRGESPVRVLALPVAVSTLASGSLLLLPRSLHGPVAVSAIATLVCAMFILVRTTD